MRTHQLTDDDIHYSWSQSRPPALTVDSGDIVSIRVRDSSDGYVRRDSSSDHLDRRPPFRGHPLTGPIEIAGAMPGQVLVVEILSVVTDAFGWSAVLAGRGLLGELFPTNHLGVWDVPGDGFARLGSVARVRANPFCGVIGMPQSGDEDADTIPPRRTGGNLDHKALTAGSTVCLPIEVPGGMVSFGDMHVAQGDGEVCVHGIETSGTIDVRLSLLDDRAKAYMVLPGTYHPASCETVGFVGIADTLDEAFRDAVLRLMTFMSSEFGVSRSDAFILASVAADLTVNQIVNRAVTVSATIPLEIFD